MVGLPAGESPLTIPLGNQKFGPVGECIYSGSDKHKGPFTSEHVVPFSFGNDVELLAASCKLCEKITSAFERLTSAFERHCGKKLFFQFRAKAGVQTRRPKERPSHLPITVRFADHIRVVNLPVQDYPAILILPILNPPGILSGAKPSAVWSDGRWNT